MITYFQIGEGTFAIDPDNIKYVKVNPIYSVVKGRKRNDPGEYILEDYDLIIGHIISINLNQELYKDTWHGLSLDDIKNFETQLMALRKFEFITGFPFRPKTLNIEE